jgi:hypothetical protein
MKVIFKSIQMKMQHMSNTKWSAAEVNSLLSNSIVLHSDQHELSILAFDQNTKCVLGIDNEGFMVFGAPQQLEFQGFSFARAKLEPNKSIQLSNGISIEPVFTFKFLANTDDEIQTISTIFAGLQNQTVDSGNTVTAQTSAQGFESYFAGLGKVRLSRQIQIGLFGELAFISNSSDKNQLIDAWHSSPFSTYDFGTLHGRLEIKTSTAPTRLHWLRSSQSVALDKNKLTYLSIYAPEVPDGISIVDLSNQIISSLPDHSKQKFSQKLSMYEIDKANMRFDLESAISSFKFVAGVSVPYMSSDDHAIVQVAWQCDFSTLDGAGNSLAWN